MPQLQGLAAQLFPILKRENLLAWVEIIEADAHDAQAILKHLNTILLGRAEACSVTTLISFIEDKLNVQLTSENNHGQSPLSPDAQTLLKDIKQLSQSSKIENQLLTERQAAVIELLTDSRFIKMSRYLITYDFRLKYYPDYFMNLCEFAKSGYDETGLFYEFDSDIESMVYWHEKFLHYKLKKNPHSEEIKQHINYIRTIIGKLYQPSWLNRTFAMFLGGVIFFIITLLFDNPICTLLKSICTYNSRRLIEVVKFPVKLFAAPFYEAQFGWSNGCGGLFNTWAYTLEAPYGLDYFAVCSFVIISLAFVSALLIAFYPSAAAFLLGISTLGFLTNLSIPLLAAVVGITTGLALTGVASLTCLLIRPSKEVVDRLIALYIDPTTEDPIAKKQQAADTSSTVKPPTISPATALAATPSAGTTTDPQADTSEVFSLNSPLLAPVQDGKAVNNRENTALNPQFSRPELKG